MAIIKKYLAKVESIKSPLPDIYTINFSSNKKFVYNPGQYLHLTLDEYDPSKQWPESRCFSIQTNPDNNLLAITFAVKGKYTRRMAEELYAGKEVWLKLPYGDLFSQNHSLSDCVFIAGGTGITPFLSLFTHKSFNEYINPRIYLGFRSKEYNIYNDELGSMQSCYESINNSQVIINTFYENIDGLIDIKKIFDECGHNSTYFIAGPPNMVKAIKNFFLENNISDVSIITDEWE